MVAIVNGDSTAFAVNHAEEEQRKDREIAPIQCQLTEDLVAQE